MTGTLTIAARELRERGFVFISAAMLSLVPFAAAFLSLTRSSDGPLSVIMMVGTITAVGFTIALSVMLGGSMVTRELAEKRLSFYFSKPVSPSAIWFGKLAGAASTLALCYVIAFGPSLAVAHSRWRGPWESSSLLFSGATIVIAIYLLLVSHGVATMVRSRSPLVALDLSLLAIAVAIVWSLMRPFIVNGALGLSASFLGGVLLMVPIAILAGGAWQLSRGRTDIRRSHRELSTFVWSATAAVLLGAAGYVSWVFAAGPRDITVENVTSNARADWVGVSGPARHRGDYYPTFLVDVKSGRSLRLAGARWRSRAEFTRGGDAVLSITPNADLQGRGEVLLHRLNEAKSDQETGIVASLWSVVVASDDLRRVATYEDHLLSVHDLASKALLASVRIPFGTGGQMFFVSDDVVRLYARTARGASGHPSPQEMRIYEFNAKTRQLVQTGTVNAVAVSMFIRVNGSGSTLVVNEYGGADGSKVRLLDARTGEQHGVINSYASLSVSPLRDGGVAFLASRGDSSFARIMDAHGSLVADIRLGARGLFGGMSELVPGRTYVAAVVRGMQHENGNGWDLYVVDAQRGVVDRVEHNYALRAQMRGDDPRIPSTAAGEYIIVDAQNTLWRWNALTGAKVKVL